MGSLGRGLGDLVLKDPDEFPWDPISGAQGSQGGLLTQRISRTQIHVRQKIHINNFGRFPGGSLGDRNTARTTAHSPPGVKETLNYLLRDVFLPKPISPMASSHQLSV